MGIDVITENIATHEGQGVYDELNAMAQWAYPNRIFKAAHWVGNSPYNNLHMVELTSFGCGPDAFILDEVRSILSRYGKNLTVLKIDDVNNIGSLRLRVRSLVESVNATPRNPEIVESVNASSRNPEISKYRDLGNKAPFTTKPFEHSDRDRVILTPYFAEGYNEFLPTIFALAGYRIESLPMATQADAEEGLHVANNDICYPATIVVGSIMRALKSGKYDLSKTAVAITGFFSTSIPNAFINREQHIRKDGLSPWQAKLVNRLLLHYAHVYDLLCGDYPFYRPFTDIMDIWRKSRRVINSAADFGEGWFLPGEICDLADHGIHKVVSLQPFGCIANHIISKGIERRYKDLYPHLSLLFLDFDAGTSDANIINRLHFLLQ